MLKQLHDDLDGAVFDDYGWPHDLTDEQILERLVALNAERVEEKRQGLIHWLRPEFQNPSGRKAETQVEIASAEESAPVVAALVWPKKPAEQTTAVRDLVRKGGAWTSAQVVSAFKGATSDGVENELDRLGELGLLVSWDEQGTRFWQWT